jgi:hypothetical protein
MCMKTNCSFCGKSIEFCDFDDDGRAYCADCREEKDKTDKRNSKVEVKGTNGKMVMLWRFCDAPKYLQALSTNGGDEDWLGFVPDSALSDEWNYFPVFESSLFDSTLDPQKIRVKNGVIWIGSHA